MLRRFARRWESLCRRCGLCCYEKVRGADGTWVLDLSRPCPWLDESDHSCRIYSRRLAVYPRCRRITVLRALFAGYLPANCGYVEALRPRWFPKPRLVLSCESEES